MEMETEKKNTFKKYVPNETHVLKILIGYFPLPHLMTRGYLKHVVKARQRYTSHGANELSLNVTLKKG
jgi:hypothetical protein